MNLSYLKLLLLALSYAHALPSMTPKDLDNKIYFAVELDPNTHKPFQVNKYFKSLGDDIPSSWTFEEPIESVPNHYLFSVPKEKQYTDDLFDIGYHARSQMLSKRSPEHINLERRLASKGVRSLEVFEPRQLYKRGLIPPAGKIDSSLQALYDIAKQFDINDPIFPEQWHLYNPVQLGHDINVTGAWAQNITGSNVKVCVIDDGLDLDNKDLADNFFAEGSWDFNDPGPSPKPRLFDDRHGTRCAGEIAAVKNEACGLGVAYRAKVAGVRILSKRIIPSDEAAAINFAMDKNDIYSCSWGPSDNGQTMEAPPEIVKKAMMTAIQKGREEKGSIYVFASGNGGALEDNCNFDGYTNSIYSITVAAIDRKGFHPSYSESCSANMVVTYSSGSGDYIHTTDVGDKCVKTHGGTSAAAPIAAGIFSLVLEANPKLTWRDMQYLVWETAIKVNDDPGWQKTPTGKEFHHAYGYGKLDAYAIVERAKTWENVKPQAWHFLPTKVENSPVPKDASKPVEFTVEVTEEDLKNSNLDHLEHIQVHVNAKSTQRGALKMTLTSPAGIKSEIMPFRKMDMSGDGVRDWNFMSVAHWGESGVGEWKLTLEHGSTTSVNLASTLIDWRLMLWGQSIDASKAKLFPGMDKIDEKQPIEVNPPSEISSIADSSATSTASSPITTVSSAESASVPPTQTESTSTTATDKPSPSTTQAAGDGKEGQDKETGESNKDENKSKYIGSLFPTFGMSKNTAAWVYGSACIILTFVALTSGYLWWLRRKRAREGKNYGRLNPLVPRNPNHDEEFGEELDYLSEFLMSDDEHEDADEHINTPYNPSSSRNSKEGRYLDHDSAIALSGSAGDASSAGKPGLSVGKKAVDLYKVSDGDDSEDTQIEKDQKGESLFELGDNDSQDDLQDTTTGAGGSKK